MIQDAKLRPSRSVRTIEDDLPQGNGKNLLTWSDDDVDATDYKNMEYYDPWQEEDNYESTPEPEVTAEHWRTFPWETSHISDAMSCFTASKTANVSAPQR